MHILAASLTCIPPSTRAITDGQPPWCVSAQRVRAGGSAVHKKITIYSQSYTDEGQASITTSQTEIPPSSPQQHMWKYLITPWCKQHFLHHTLNLQTIQGLQKKTLIYKMLFPQCTLVLQELTRQQKPALKEKGVRKKASLWPLQSQTSLKPSKRKWRHS